jgi:phenylalanyl-tRNA synthetase beta chain
VSAELFDVFRSDQLGADRRSLAYTVRLQAPDHTLTDAEVAEARDALIAAVSTTHAATLRT